jgi:hypothetical protein
MKEIIDEYGALLLDGIALAAFAVFFMAMLFDPVKQMIETYGFVYF